METAGVEPLFSKSTVMAVLLTVFQYSWKPLTKVLTKVLKNFTEAR